LRRKTKKREEYIPEHEGEEKELRREEKRREINGYRCFLYIAIPSVIFYLKF
jgi:hypothetical protein